MHHASLTLAFQTSSGSRQVHDTMSRLCCSLRKGTGDSLSLWGFTLGWVLVLASSDLLFDPNLICSRFHVQASKNVLTVRHRLPFSHSGVQTSQPVQTSAECSVELNKLRGLFASRQCRRQLTAEKNWKCWAACLPCSNAKNWEEQPVALRRYQTFSSFLTLLPYLHLTTSQRRWPEQPGSRSFDDLAPLLS